MGSPISIRAHFDGKTIVPDEPVELRPNESIIVDIRRTQDPNQNLTTRKPSEKSSDERRAALSKLVRMMADFPEVPLDETRRINIYDNGRY